MILERCEVSLAEIQREEFARAVEEQLDKTVKASTQNKVTCGLIFVTRLMLDLRDVLATRDTECATLVELLRQQNENVAEYQQLLRKSNDALQEAIDIANRATETANRALDSHKNACL